MIRIVGLCAIALVLAAPVAHAGDDSPPAGILNGRTRGGTSTAPKMPTYTAIGRLFAIAVSPSQRCWTGYAKRG